MVLRDSLFSSSRDYCSFQVLDHRILFFSEKRRDRWDQAEQNLDVGDRCRKFDHIFRGSPLEILVQQWIYDDLWNLPFGKLT